MRGSARVFADVEAPVIVIEEGVLFDGHCRMTTERPAEAPSGREAAPAREAGAPVVSFTR
jgi:cytoskeletal protein CcmA (bactofilin family)